MRITFAFMLFIHVVTCLSIGLNIPIMRQIFGFIYITFMPGLFIIRILGLKEKSKGNIFLFSVGLSIAFLMFIGLIVNSVYPLFGVSNPLSAAPLTITIFSSAFVLFLAACRKDFANVTKHSSVIKLRTMDICFYALLSLLLILTVVGAVLTNISLLIIVVIGIATLYAISVFLGKQLPAGSHLPIILVISLCLLLHMSLISSHLMGYDIFNEYYTYRLTKTLNYWKPPGVVLDSSTIDILNSILSTTILPVIYSTFLNLDGELIFKLVYPFVFSLVPLCLYKIYKLQMGKSVAFLSVLLFVSNATSFYSLEILSLAREMIGEFFFVLAIFCLINKSMPSQHRKILFMVFSAALVVSHYSLSYIFLFYVFFTFAIQKLRNKEATIYLGQLLFLFAITFLWYMYISTPPLNKLIESFQNMITSFVADIFETKARFQPGVASLSPTAQSTIVGMIHKGLFYIVHFFIAVGIAVLVLKPREFKLNPEFRLMAVLSGLILLLCFAVPNFAPALNFTRFYQITMLFLSPFFALGGTFLVKSTKKSFAYPTGRFAKIHLKDLELRALTLMLIAFFLFQVGFFNHITNDYPYSFSLDLYRKQSSDDLSIVMGFYSSYVSDQEVHSARWLSENMDRTLKVYADSNSKFHVLSAYAFVAPNQTDSLYRNMSITDIKDTSPYVYLSFLNGFDIWDNVQDGVIITAEGTNTWFNASEISGFLDQIDTIYSNGHNEIYQVP